MFARFRFPSIFTLALLFASALSAQTPTPNADVAPSPAAATAAANPAQTATTPAPTPKLVSLPPILNIGVTESPPFSTKVGDHWEGLSIDLWNTIAARKNIRVVFTQTKWSELSAAFTANKLDIGPVNAITARGVGLYSYSVPIISSNLSLVTLQQSHATWKATLRQFRKSGVIGVLAAILVMNFIVGLLLWLIERKRNATQFGGEKFQGLGSAIWCAITTMTTVGYGDKVPVTWAGRLLCFVVMLTGVVVISIFTATAGSAMTVARLETEVNTAADLRNVTCVALNHSTGGDYIRSNGLRGIFVKSLDEAFDKLIHGEAAVLIHDKIRVEAILKNESRGAVVLPLNLKEDYFAFALPLNDPLKPTIDTAIEEALDSDAWTHAQTNSLGQ